MKLGVIAGAAIAFLLLQSPTSFGFFCGVIVATLIPAVEEWVHTWLA